MRGHVTCLMQIKNQLRPFLGSRTTSLFGKKKLEKAKGKGDFKTRERITERAFHSSTLSLSLSLSLYAFVLTGTLAFFFMQSLRRH
ncbi:hypothetical protein RJT34_26808 [Clitoria ternatea]|uniref:Transmembrane protein n=1 Tax=Clitoria ternatea TaxID=43366 RepID=A0AAN9F749_CLITE